MKNDSVFSIDKKKKKKTYNENIIKISQLALIDTESLKKKSSKYIKTTAQYGGEHTLPYKEVT